MKRYCQECFQERIVCDRHNLCEQCESSWGPCRPYTCFAKVVSIPLPRSRFPFSLYGQRGEIGLQLCLIAMATFFAFHIGAFVARRGDALITFILKAAGL